MALTLKQLTNMYERYLEKHAQAKQKFNELDIVVSRPISKRDYIEQYSELKNTNSKLRVTDEIIESQIVRMSKKQAKVLQESLVKQFGYKKGQVKLEDLRNRRFEDVDAFWSIVSEEQQKLRDSGFSEEEIKNEIGSLFFGSE